MRRNKKIGWIFVIAGIGSMIAGYFGICVRRFCDENVFYGPLLTGLTVGGILMAVGIFNFSSINDDKKLALTMGLVALIVVIFFILFL